ncbi:MAG: SusC/RagA family TonB-linked outer membrane protein [Bacteroidia bacterium]|nr:SusC/RagA family TonB-linked outer membrane protein [Bacteroidia bacterium]
MAFGLLSCSFAWAQFTATGEVKDNNGEPVIGATVAIKGTALGVLTDENGGFSLRVPSSTATLLISYFGFSTVEQDVDANSGKLSISLEELETTLDEVVVTGLATSVKRSNLANSVEQIDADALTGVTSQPTMDGALYGKFKGAEIRANSGAPGGGMSVRLRGVTSIFGDQQPLFIIDGVYLDNSTISLGTNIVTAAAGGGNASTNQDDASNRIADIDPEDIEKIEILKGASAAAIYGARAAGGVIIINTKKGRSGRTKVKLSQTTGFTRPIRLLGMRDWDEDLVLQEFPNDIDLFRQNGVQNFEDSLYNRTGLLSTTRAEFSGGNAKTSFFVGGTFKTEDGIVDNTGYEKASIRVNVDQRLTDWLTINVSSNYINSESDRGLFNNGNTNTTVGYALAFTRPWFNLSKDQDGNFPAVPSVGSNALETVSEITNRENVNRFIGGLQATLRLISTEKNKLNIFLRGGLDQYTLITTGYFSPNLSFYRDPTSLGGVSLAGRTTNTNSNLEAYAIHTIYPSNGLSFRTQIGVQQLDFNRNTLIGTATDLNGSQQNLDQARNQSIEQIRTIQQDKGLFVQEEINYQDKIIVTGGVRADKSSNNGNANQIFYYPKANAAINFHEFDFWTVNGISNFKIRAAYGESSRFPTFSSRFTNILGPTQIGGLPGFETSGLLGNPDIEPERQRELEFGADFGFLNNRITFDATYYIKTISNLLLQAQTPTSSGFTSRAVNAGELQNQGIELGLNARIVDNADLKWDFGVKWWRNRNLVTELDVPAFNLGGFAASLGQYRIEEGKPATQIVGTIDPSDCGTPDCSDLDPEGDGFAVYGDAQADFDMSFNNMLSYKGLEFTFLLHWKQGGDGINLSTLLYDLGGLTWDFDETTLDPTGEEGNGNFRLNSWFAGDTSPWIEDASYVRLREIGAFYNVPKSVFNDAVGLKVGLSARNLLNFFTYNSYDPEVSNFGNNVLANNVEVTPYPSTRRFYLHITAKF